MRTQEEKESMLCGLKSRMRLNAELKLFGSNKYFKYESAYNAVKNNWDETDLRVHPFRDKESKLYAEEAVKWLNGGDGLIILS